MVTDVLLLLTDDIKKKKNICMLVKTKQQHRKNIKQHREKIS